MLGIGKKSKRVTAPVSEETNSPELEVQTEVLDMEEGDSEPSTPARAPQPERPDTPSDLPAMVGAEAGAQVGSVSVGPVGPKEELAQSVSDAVAESVAHAETYTTQEDLLKLYAQQVGMPFVKLSEQEYRPDVINILSPELAREYQVFPVDLDDETGALTVALVDPLNVRTLDDLAVWLGREVRGVVANADEVQAAIEESYGTGEESVDDMLKSLTDEQTELDIKEEDFDDLTRIANEAPIVKLVNLILLQAIKERGSDLHVEPFESSLRIRYRVDGILHETVPPPPHLTNAIISRFKVMSGLNIAERRLPQDGRIKLTLHDRNVELRVSCLPTVNGESVVMRILDSQVMSLSLAQIGMLPDTLDRYGKIISRPNGIVLVTGPTGCGKTTTMYASLRHIFSPMLKMITTENPVEYQMDGVVQVNINQSVGLTFARCLRAILRQDPDIIMVGEIRDLETASMAIESSLTGHMVLSTMHTNDSSGTLTRLIDMNVEPFLIASAVVAVMAQRLIRIICLDCKEPYEPDPALIREMGFSPEEVQNITFFHGKGCSSCNYTGYRGRTGMFELLVMSEKLKELVLERAASSLIFQEARKEGMRTLREDGWEKVVQGITTIEEVLASAIH